MGDQNKEEEEVSAEKTMFSQISRSYTIG